MLLISMLPLAAFGASIATTDTVELAPGVADPGAGAPSPAPASAPGSAPAAPAPASTLTSDPASATAAAPAWNTYQETNLNISYAGAWSKASSSASSGGAVWLTSAKGASATFTFTGTGVEWIGIKAATYGTATVSVDGGSATTVKMTASSTSYQQALFHKESLTNKTHTLKITVTSAKPKLVCIDAFKVQGIAGVPDPAPHPATPSGNGWVAYTETSAYLNYYGTWTKAASSASAGGAVKLTNKKGAAFQIRFKGDAIEWDGIRAATYGKAQVTLDTVSQGTVNMTTNATYHKQALFRKSGLDASKVHTLTVTVTSAAPALVCIDNIMVHGGSALSFAPATAAGNGWNAYQETSSYVYYSNGWSKATSGPCSGGAVRLTRTKGAFFQVVFKGDAIEWDGILAKTYGSAVVVLDGVTQKTVTMTISSATQYQQALFHREGLNPNALHTLRVVVSSSAPKLVCLDRLMIRGTIGWTSGNASLDSRIRTIQSQLGSTGDVLLKSFNYVRAFPYIRTPDIPTGDYSVPYALSMLQKHGGNCYRFAALFCVLARAYGYNAKVISGTVPRIGGGRAPHGWVEITQNGKVYVCDPDLSKNYPSRNWFMFTYSQAPTDYRK